MRLLRIGTAGNERPAALVGDTAYVDLSDVVRDFDADFFESDGLNRIRDVVATRFGSGQIHELVVRGSGRRSRGRTRSCASV